MLMKKSLLGGLVLAAVSGSALFAQDLTGSWQGTLETPQRPLRLVFKIEKGPDQALKVVG
jgi:hypothetical protein